MLYSNRDVDNDLEQLAELIRRLQNKVDNLEERLNETNERLNLYIDNQR